MRIEAPVPRIALTPAEAAAALGVSLSFLEDSISAELKWVRRGRKRFVAVTELARWVDENSEAPMADQVASGR